MIDAGISERLFPISAEHGRAESSNCLTGGAGNGRDDGPRGAGQGEVVTAPHFLFVRMFSANAIRFQKNHCTTPPTNRANVKGGPIFG